MDAKLAGRLQMRWITSIKFIGNCKRPSSMLALRRSSETLWMSVRVSNFPQKVDSSRTESVLI